MNTSDSLPTTPLTTLLGSQGPVHALAYSASPGTYILTGSSDRSIRLYNPFPTSTSSYASNTSSSITSQHSRRGAITPSKLIQTYSAHGYEVLDLAVSRDNSRFVSSGGDRTVFLWDVGGGKTIRRFGGNNSSHTARVNSVCFAGTDDALVISASFDATVRFWDCRGSGHKPVQVLSEARDSVSAVVVAGREGTEVVTGSVDGRVRWYDVRMGRVTSDVVGAPVTSLMPTGDGGAVLVGTLDGTVRLMDRGAGTCLMSYKGHVNQEYRIRSCFGAREKVVLSGSEGVEGREVETGEVVMWETVTGTVLKRVVVPARVDDGTRKRVVGSDGKEKVRKNVISAVAWKDSGKGNQWCCAGTDGVVTVFGNAPG